VHHDATVKAANAQCQQLRLDGAKCSSEQT
jgi:hypothetical protein